jgi:starvation-inducible outer membrane lipoprotein
MNPRQRRWSRGYVLLLVCGMAFMVGCSAVPRKYLSQVDPSTTLTDITDHPDQYQGKVVILGGARLDEREHDGHVWLHVRNRPLDKEYKPHLPRDPGSHEGSTYWITVTDRSEFPSNYKHWARMTVVGRVIGWMNESTGGIREPVLGLMYVRGWGLSSDHDGAWESRIDPNYLLTTPRGLLAPRQQSD